MHVDWLPHSFNRSTVINECFFIWCLPNIPTAFYVDHLSKTKKQCTNARYVYTHTHTHTHTRARARTHTRTHTHLLFIYKHMYNIPEHLSSAVVSPFYNYLGQQLVYSNYGWKVCLPAVLSRSLSRSTQVMNFIKTFSMAANHRIYLHFLFQWVSSLCTLIFRVYAARKLSQRFSARVN